MKSEVLLKHLEGVQSVKSVTALLGVSRKKAIQLVYQLRKKGYVKTKRRSDNTRVYSISFENRLGGVSYYDIINEHSPVKVATPRTFLIYGKKPSLEEALVFAVKSGSLRMVLASLALFRKIHDWPELYRLAKLNDVARQVGALYDLSRRLFRTRRLFKRFERNALPKKSDKYVYIIEGLRSDFFSEIERKWKVYLPFNIADLEDYK